MSDPRIIFIGKKPVHTYIRAVKTVMSEGERLVEITARGASIRTAVDVAEICRRRNGFIAGQLPEEVLVRNISIDTEELPRDDGKMGNVSVIRIQLEGLGDMPEPEPYIPKPADEEE